MLRGDTLRELADFVGLATVPILGHARFRLLDHFVQQAAGSQSSGAGRNGGRGISLPRLRNRSAMTQPQFIRSLLKCRRILQAASLVPQFSESIEMLKTPIWMELLEFRQMQM